MVIIVLGVKIGEILVFLDQLSVRCILKKRLCSINIIFRYLKL
jgi:hypothetical protein